MAPIWQLQITVEVFLFQLVDLQKPLGSTVALRGHESGNVCLRVCPWSTRHFFLVDVAPGAKAHLPLLDGPFGTGPLLVRIHGIGRMGLAL